MVARPDLPRRINSDKFEIQSHVNFRPDPQSFHGRITIHTRRGRAITFFFRLTEILTQTGSGKLNRICPGQAKDCVLYIRMYRVHSWEKIWQVFVFHM